MAQVSSRPGAESGPLAGRAAESSRSDPLARILPAASPALSARFWGVRGSHPVAHGSGSRIGVNTACLEVRYGRHVVVLDAGSGIVGLGDALVREYHTSPPEQRPYVTLLFTHAHHDHLCGLPFFAPLFLDDVELHLLGPDLAGLAFEEIIAGYMRSPYFPVDFHDLPSRRTLRSAGDGARYVLAPESAAPLLWKPERPLPPGAMTVDVLYSHLHPRDGTLMYRISAGGRSLVFATDVEIGEGGNLDEQRFIQFARGADVLVHDAQYSEDDYSGASPHRGYGHSTPTMAARIARAAGVGKLVLFHHDPGYADADISALEHEAQRLFPTSLSAREGLELCLDEGGTRRI